MNTLAASQPRTLHHLQSGAARVQAALIFQAVIWGQPRGQPAKECRVTGEPGWSPVTQNPLSNRHGGDESVALHRCCRP